MDMLAPHPTINRIELVVVIRDRHGVLGNSGDDHVITVRRRFTPSEGLDSELHSFQFATLELGPTMEESSNTPATDGDPSLFTRISALLSGSALAARAVGRSISRNVLH
jgi:hypothetical protein